MQPGKIRILSGFGGRTRRLLRLPEGAFGFLFFPVQLQCLFTIAFCERGLSCSSDDALLGWRWTGSCLDQPADLLRRGDGESDFCLLRLGPLFRSAILALVSWLNPSLAMAEMPRLIDSIEVTAGVASGSERPSNSHRILGL